MTIYSKQPRKILYRKKCRHEPSGWALYTSCSFDKKENKLNYYRGKYCVEKACKKLKEVVMEIINRGKKEMIPLTQEENNFYNKQGICYICKEKFCIDKDDKNYINKRKVKGHCHYTGKFRGAADSICNSNYNDQKEFPITIHNATYDTHFILKVNLIVLRIIWKNISLFLYQLRKKLLIMMVKRKQLHTNLNLLIVLDLCQIHYQILFITHQEFLII